MRLDVTQLLTEPIGTTRYHLLGFHKTIAQGEPEAYYQGEVTLLRTDEGILVSADLRAEVTLECSRCLTPFTQELPLRFEEELLVAEAAEPGGGKARNAGYLPKIEEQRFFDFGEIVRQETLVQLPMQPFCRPDCAGLCPHCGADLRDGTCNCEEGVRDPRWATLEELVRGGHKSLEGER